MVLLTWLLGVSCGDTWLFLPNLVEVWDVGSLCRETLVSRGRSSVPRASLSQWLLPHVFDFAGSAGVVLGLTWVAVEAFLCFHCLVVLCGRCFSLYYFVE
ncbi:hypothetical protein Taro_052572 [Colocasia esculenta]|uniref:Uncharacterized protein n=1 Tax=Colocasia esculenta TaxID=4460 RepID=A0A843XJR6_COLES|nr:hypothetical protein [Colocasia esculenta]